MALSAGKQYGFFMDISIIYGCVEWFHLRVGRSKLGIVLKLCVVLMSLADPLFAADFKRMFTLPANVTKYSQCSAMSCCFTAQRCSQGSVRLLWRRQG